jgi:hypothetical protein
MKYNDFMLSLCDVLSLPAAVLFGYIVLEAAARTTVMPKLFAAIGIVFGLIYPAGMTALLAYDYFYWRSK